MSATNKITALLAALLLAAPLHSQIRPKQVDTTEDLVFDGIATVTGLPIPSADSDAATKKFVEDNTGTSQEALTLTGASDTISPASASDVVNVLPAISSPAAKYSFYHRMNSSEPDEFDTSVSGYTVEAGTPAFSGGSLDLTGGTSTSTAQAVSYFRSDAGGLSIGQVNNSTVRYFGFRENFRLNWSGATPPTCAASTIYRSNLLYMDNGSETNSGVRNQMLMYIDNNGVLRLTIQDSSGTSQVNFSHDIDNGDQVWRENKTYEVELNCQWGNPGLCEAWIDGHRFRNLGTDTSMFGFVLNFDNGARIVFGGEGGSTWSTDVSPGCSNHYVDDFVWWYDVTATETDVREHSDQLTYPVTYMPPGDSTGFETIDKLTATNYEEGDIVTLVNAADGANWELIPSDAGVPAATEMVLVSKFSPTIKGDSIRLQLSVDGYWREVSRHYEDPTSGGAGTDQVTLTASSDTLTTQGGDRVKVSGSATALAADVTYKKDFSDNTFAPQYTAGQDINFAPDTYWAFVPEAVPTATGGVLNMNTTGEQRSARYWFGDGANWDNSTNNAGAVRFLWTPQYTGTPTQHIGLFGTNGRDDTGACSLDANNNNCALGIRIVHAGSATTNLTSGEIMAAIWNGGTIRYAVTSSGFSAVSGTTYEVEFNWDFDAGFAYLFIDGALEGSVAIAGVWGGTQSNGLTHQAFMLGGMDDNLGGTQPTNDDHDAREMQGLSNHTYDGFAVFNEIQHTTGYTATGLPGASAAVETITKLTTAETYREGQIIILEAADDGRFIMQSDAEPVADELLLNSNWEPDSGHLLALQRTGAFWTEAWRYPQLSVATGAGNVFQVEAFGPTDPEPTSTTFVTIDLSKDSAPENAIGAVLAYAAGTANTASVRLRPDSASGDTQCTQSQTGAGGTGHCIAWFEGGTQQFEAAWSAAPGAISLNQMLVFGYILENSIPTNIANLIVLDEPDDIGDWVASSVVAFADVDVSDDSVPAGAEAVFIRIVMQSSATDAGAQVRRNGSAITGTEIAACVDLASDASGTACDVLVPLDANRVFEAKFNAAWTVAAGVNNAYVLGYTLRTTPDGGRFFPLDEVDIIGDWIASSVVTPTLVDLTDDSVPDDASAAVIGCLFDSVGTVTNVFARKAATFAGHNVQVVETVGAHQEWTVPLSFGTFEAQFGGAWTATTNQCHVVGYYK